MLLDIETQKTVTFMRVTDGSYIISTKSSDGVIVTSTKQNGDTTQVIKMLLQEMGVGDLFCTQIAQAVSCIIIGRLDRLRNIK